MLLYVQKVHLRCFFFTAFGDTAGKLVQTRAVKSSDVLLVLRFGRGSMDRVFWLAPRRRHHTTVAENSF
jgi:hypothetical protein